MAKQNVSNTELKTGRFVGQERKFPEPDNVRYFSKCPFGIYFVVDIYPDSSKGCAKKKTMLEVLSTIRNHRQLLMLAAKAYPEFKNLFAERIKENVLAELELQSYSQNDVIRYTKVGRRELKDRYSAAVRQVRLKYGNSAF